MCLLIQPSSTRVQALQKKGPRLARQTRRRKHFLGDFPSETIMHSDVSKCPYGFLPSAKNNSVESLIRINIIVQCHGITLCLLLPANLHSCWLFSLHYDVISELSLSDVH